MTSQRKKPAAIGVKAPFPGFIEPALATSIEKVPSGARWLHEIKFDGYRVQVHLANEAVKVFTRRGNDWTKRFRKIADDAWHIGAGSAIIDGEVVVPGANSADLCPPEYEQQQHERRNNANAPKQDVLHGLAGRKLLWRHEGQPEFRNADSV
jgi:ATP-dependent DNA ligase